MVKECYRIILKMIKKDSVKTTKIYQTSVNEKKVNEKDEYEYSLIKSPGYSHTAQNLMEKTYHNTMDKFHSEYLKHFWASDDEKDLHTSFENTITNLEERNITNTGIACILHRLCMMCYNGDHILQLSKCLLRKLPNTNIQDKIIFQLITSHLQAYPYIKKRKPGKAIACLEQGNEAMYNLEPCEWTAWFHRAKASVYLQCAWMSEKSRLTYKDMAIENFKQSRYHFSYVQKDNSSSQYLQFLSILSLINLVFINLKFCWFIFDKHTTQKRFEESKYEIDIQNIEKMILQVEHESHLLANDSIFLYDIQYHILRVKFFVLYRKAQQYRKQNLILKAERHIKDAIEVVKDLKNLYKQGDNNSVLNSLETIAHFFRADLPVNSFVNTKTEQKDILSGNSSNSNSSDLSSFSCQSSNENTDYNSDL